MNNDPIFNAFTRREEDSDKWLSEVHCEWCESTIDEGVMYFLNGNIAICEHCAEKMTTRELIEALGCEVNVVR